MEITVVGGFGVGKTIQISRAPEAGETVSGGRYSEGPGGKGSNQAVQMARLGATVSLISAVGDDALATMGRDLWAVEGVDSTGVVTKAEPTMVGFIIVDSAGENRIALAPGALETMTPADLEPLYPLLDRSDMVVVSFELNPEVGLSALAYAREAGLRTLCNPAPAHVIPPASMSDIDVLIPNYTEALMLAGLGSSNSHEPRELAQALRGLGAKSVVITLGGKGAFVDDGDRQELVPAVLVDKVVDTTGAGDSFVGAVAVALSRGEDLFEATRFATMVAARTVATAEVIPALPYAAELMTTKGTL
jgi:ribokinase